MNSLPNINHKTIFKFLIPLAVIAFIVYATALFNLLKTEKVHAAEPVLFPNVAIEDDSMRPLALALALPTVKATVDVSAKTNTDSDVNNNDNDNDDTNNVNTSGSVNTNSNTSAKINTTADLDLYTKTLKESDKDISDVEVEDDHIVVGYREPAKFLGFVPVNVTVHAQVDADGDVTLHYPWYTFLSVKDDAQLKADIQARTAEVLGNRSGMNIETSASSTTRGTPNGNASLTAFSARARAELIQAIHQALRTHSNVNAQASTHTTVTTNR